MDDTIHNDKGPINEVILEDGFEVHGLMFNVKDVVQCLFLCSATMYKFFNNPMCNCFAITINTKDKFIMATPMTINNEFNECVIRNNADTKTPQLDVTRLKNTYSKQDDNQILMFLSKGYILDNFVVNESYHDFLLKEGEPHVKLYADDIESLTLKNPYVE